MEEGGKGQKRKNQRLALLRTARKLFTHVTKRILKNIVGLLLVRWYSYQ